ncbi:MAG: response regulator [Pararhodobacter sp.]|nr:response regulator [Pararhodobacter sp.]
MVIEDEPNIAEAIRFILQRAGWTVAIHDQGDDALTRIEALAPRLIILDVMLPGRSGFDILEALRSHDSLAGIPVIMLTAKGHATDRQRAERLGASLFMTKPFSNTELLTAVRRLLLP